MVAVRQGQRWCGDGDGDGDREHGDVVQAIAEDVRRFSLEANSTGIEQHANFLEGDIGDGQLIVGGRVDPTRGLGAQLVLVSGVPG